jgi:osmotically-inducible protein OsmY
MSADGTPARAPVRSDDEIRNSVLMELKWDPKITSTDVGVAVKDGAVTLTGFVPGYWSSKRQPNESMESVGLPTISPSKARVA